MKLYKEFVNEMKWIKGISDEYNIQIICNTYNIKNYTINKDLSVDVDGAVYLFDKGLKTLPLNFNVVTGSFNCAKNKLISLKGSPKDVGSYDCSDNKITSLEYSPGKVNEIFLCASNPGLSSLKGAPKYIGGIFTCTYCNLTDLEFCPEYIGGDFNLQENPLISLKGLPKTFELKHLWISSNQTSLVWNWIYDNLLEDINLFKNYAKWAMQYRESMPKYFEKEFGYLLEINDYNHEN